MSRPATTAPETAEVFDLGYARYDGPRGSRWTGRRAIVRDSVRTTLGLGRGAGAKIAPWLLLGLMVAPALVLVVVSALAGSLGADESDLDLPGLADYYSFAMVPAALFAAIVAPELLCPDRRHGVLTLYAVRPVGALDYVLSRLAGFLAVALLALWLPEALLFTWNLLQADDTGSWVRDNWGLVPRFLLAGALVGVLFTSIAMLAASLTTRRAYAAVITLAALFVGSVIAGVGMESLDGAAEEALSLVGLPQAVDGAVLWAFGDEPVDRPHGGGVDAAWVAAVSVLTTAALAWRTRRRLYR
jgi:ABC-2 type transport system permease protein